MATAIAPVCEHCGGTGWRLVQKDGLSAVKRCDCGGEGRAERAVEASQIPPLYRNASFENFKLPTENPIARQGLSEVLLTVRGYAREFPATDRPGLLFIGDPGCGKTHLAVAALRILISRGFDGLFFDYQNLLERIRCSFDSMSGASDREAYRSALDAEILLLDDLGAHRVTEWVEDTVTSIITWRCNNQKPTIVTTNLADGEAGAPRTQRSDTPGAKPEYRLTLAERIGVRARSRLFEMCRVIRMPQVEDYRIRRGR
jgi:DNA replication protein DnaC